MTNRDKKVKASPYGPNVRNYGASSGAGDEKRALHLHSHHFLTSITAVAAFISLTLILLCANNVSLVTTGAVAALGLPLCAASYRREWRRFPITLFAGSFAVYVLMAAAVENPAVSDFAHQFNAAKAFVEGNPDVYGTAVHGWWGKPYFYVWGGSLGGHWSRRSC